jgi:hypothetical protein
MKRAFVLLTKDATALNQDAIGKAFDMVGWWHWFPQAWVFVDPTGVQTAVSIRDRVMSACPNLVFYVFQLDISAGYAGFAPSDWEDWLKTNFKSSPSTNWSALMKR